VYAAAWIDERPGLRPKTIRLYRYLLRSHLTSTLTSKAVAEITDAGGTAELCKFDVSDRTAVTADRKSVV
jgi:hypothetical protein